MESAAPTHCLAPRLISRAQYLDRLSKERCAGSSGHASRSASSSSSCATRSRPNRGCIDEIQQTHKLDDGIIMDPMGMGLPAMQLAHAPTNGIGMPVSDNPGARGVSKSRRVADNFVNRVVESCGPAVVRVEMEQKVEMPAMDNSDIFSFFFGVRPERQQQERRVHGHGSGFCIDGKQGIVLTNAHVVEGADRITVSFAGHGAPLDCEVLETDEVIDLAVLQTKDRPKTRLPEMELGSSESLKTGDWAIVLGNPFGLQNTCTLGIVSSLDRSTGETGFDWMRHPLLQTDAAVNQGNSGGPMLNEVGQVVGMISMRALFGEGIGFAIPIDSIKSAAPTLMKRKKVPRAYLGLKLSSSSPQSRSAGRDRDGCFVEMVVPRSPADEAGFEADDRILEAAGKKVRRFDEVQALVRSSSVGTKLTFKVQRGEEAPRSITVAAADIRQLKNNAEKTRKRGGGPRQIIIVPSVP